MSTRTIPAQTISTCDCCEAVLDRGNWREEGVLHLKRHALDMQGTQCADASVRADLCDSCLHVVAEAINGATKAIRGKAMKQEAGKP